MLRIYRYLAVASAVLLLLALVLAAAFYRHQAMQDLVAMSTQHNITVDRILANTIWTRFGDRLFAVEGMDAEALRARPETAEIGAALGSIGAGLEVLKVKIYDRSGRVIYSSKPAEIGGNASSKAGIMAVIAAGEPVSKLSYKNRFTAFSRERFGRDVVETYVPRYDAAGKLAGIMELYADVSEARTRIDRTILRLLVGLTLLFGLVYAILVTWIMRRAIAPIRLASRRAGEIGPQVAGVRLPTEGMPREILPLLLAINAALDRLDRALESQRRFTADAAHELLTPLAVMRAQIDSLDDGSVAEPLRGDLDAMTDMIHQLLELAELEAQAGPAGEPAEADLHGVATEVIAKLAPLAIREGKELALTGAAGPIPVSSCPRMLGRVLRNLVENALRHTPPHSTVELDLDAGGVARVSDQGPGVPPDQRRAIFQRFWRGEKQAGSGAGLGLAIVQRIVEGIGGRIWVEDAPGGGARFVVRLTPAGGDPGTRGSEGE